MLSFNEEIIIKYIENSCTSEELESLLEWILLSDENKIHFLTIKKIYNLKKINHYSQPLQVENALIKFNQQIDNTQKEQRRKYILRYSKYAALVILFIGIPFIFWLTKFNISGNLTELYTVNVSKNSPVKVVLLSDGTKVWINSGSTFQYPAHFIKKERNVKLKGEAYFEVKSDTLHPFIVQADELKVRVYGTTFNINTDTYDRSIKTTLVSGCVAIQSIYGKNLAILHPDQMATYNNQTKNIEIDRVNSSLYTSWRLGLILLETATLKEITNKLQEFYQVNIIINRGFKFDKKYNFVFRNNQSIDQVMEMLKFVTPITYKKFDNTIYINLK
ncbi:MAG: FecR family protein [Bacteroidota bacterium]|nr:FecR family protein [Bacteroidota bacterium]